MPSLVFDQRPCVRKLGPFVAYLFLYANNVMFWLLAFVIFDIINFLAILCMHECAVALS
jgi:hypothetical protein